MARKVFFSFHYENDAWRSGQVRNSWVTKKDRDDAGFWDSASWEEVKKKSDGEIKKWIDKQMDGTSVSVVLLGTETTKSKWVKYELEQSWKKGNGILGIYIHQIKDSKKQICKKGSCSFGEIFVSDKDNKKYFYQRFPTYDWVDDDGYANLGEWVEKAAKAVGR